MSKISTQVWLWWAQRGVETLGLLVIWRVDFYPRQRRGAFHEERWQMLVSSEWTNVVERVWDGEVIRDSAWESQTKESPEGESQYYLVVTAACWEAFTLVLILFSLGNVPIWIYWLTSDNYNSVRLQKVEHLALLIHFVHGTYSHYIYITCLFYPECCQGGKRTYFPMDTTL